MFKLKERRIVRFLEMVLQSRKLLAVLWVCFFAAMNANAANLNDVGFSSLPGDRVEISLVFDGAPPEVSGYTIEKPARIALDLPGVSSKLTEKYHNLGMGNAKRMTVIGTKDRTRVILDLVDLVPYSTRANGNTLHVVIGSEDAGTGALGTMAAQKVTSENTFVKKATSARNMIQNIDFHRGDKGDGQVVISFESADVDIDMSEVGGNIQLRMPKVDLPLALRQRLDVVDFATPVRRIDSDVVDNDAIITIKSAGHYDYLAYQADNKFTVSVEELTKEEVDQRKKDKFPFTGEKLSLNFQNIEVRAVLQLIADFTSLNLVASDTVGGSITLRLQNVPWDQALELILKTKGLDKRKNR